MSQDYRKEFPDFPVADMPAIPEGFEDWSWHNDACPSFANDTLGLHIYVDYVDVAMREMPDDGGRFFVFTIGPDGALITGDTVLVTDDWNKVLHHVADVKSELDRQILAHEIAEQAKEA